MQPLFLTLVLLAAMPNEEIPLQAAKQVPSSIESKNDSLRQFDIEEAVVVASPKETSRLREQSLSVSLFNLEGLESRGVRAVKDLSSLAPNIHMPDYGSRLTSAIYIRGVGSRINTPAVGLYVDNVPYIDKTAYDFSFAGVERVDVLRGPQGTLYGRNTMGGLIRVFTADPITRYGTDFSFGMSTRNTGRRASLTTYLHPAEDMGISLRAYYEGSKGFFRNATTGQKQDGEDVAGGRLRWSWRASDVVKLDWTASYEYSKEDACPYFYLGDVDDETLALTVPSESSGTSESKSAILQNRMSFYKRHLFNTGVGVEHRFQNFTLSSITAYQHLQDDYFIDQDFISQDLFSLEQKQYMHTFTEEIALKSHERNNKWKWTTGIFAMYQYARTKCPVIFYSEGVDYLNAQIASALPTSPSLSVELTDQTLPFRARLVTPSVNAAAFHQSSINDFLVKGLTLTLGLRLDYEYKELRMNSGTSSTVPYSFAMSMGTAMSFSTEMTADPTLDGKLCNDAWQVLPKAALSYALPRNQGNIYFSVAKGYRSGGYNIQSYSDLSEAALRRALMLGVKDYSVSAISSLSLPDATKQTIIDAMSEAIDENTPEAPEISSLYYKPEYTWSYEAGTHLNLAERALQLDFSAFYMKTIDQQLARFSDSGFGRETVNAGRSKSLGLEVALRSQLLADRLRVSLSYGYTHAEFTNYNLGTSTDTGEEIDYTGNRVPYVPEHTFNVSADFSQPLKGNLFRAISVGADVNGAGSVVWDEANSFSQDFYATLNARVGLELVKNIRLELWGKNLTGSRFATFSFDSMDRRFAQYNAPRHFGFDLSLHF